MSTPNTAAAAPPPDTLHRTLIVLDGAKEEVRTMLQDVHLRHTFIMRMFKVAIESNAPVPDAWTFGAPLELAETPSPRADIGILYAFDTAGMKVRVMVQSRQAPDAYQVGQLAAQGTAVHTWTVPTSFDKGQVLAFDLQGNTVELRTRESARRLRPIANRAGKLAWIARQGQAHGFEMVGEPTFGWSENLHSEIKSPPRSELDHGSRGFIVTVTRYRGSLQVTDPELFKAAQATGIGHSKAYGCGLLMVNPVS